MNEQNILHEVHTMRSRFTIVLLLMLAATALPALAQQPQRWGRPHPPRAGACFYLAGYFNGDYFCMAAGDRWGAMPRGFNDVISSIKVFGGARVRVFNDGNFQGASAFIDRDVDNLFQFSTRDNPTMNWNDRISSIIVMGGGDDRDRGPYRDQPRPDRNPYQR
jgi:hypothetical protein